MSNYALRITHYASRFTPYVLIGAWTLALHAHTLHLPFLWDDMIMLQMARSMSWSGLFTSGYMYYRPLYFATLKLLELLTGWISPFLLHAISLGLHAANSMLVAGLTTHILQGKSRQSAGMAAGLIFAAFPYTYEVLALAVNMYQTDMAFWGLSTVVCYACFRSSGKKGWLWGSWGLALISAFTCEYGVLTPAFIALIEIVFKWQRRIEKIRLPPGYVAFAVIYLIVWRTVPTSRAEPPLILQGLEPALRDMPITALYYLQGLTYPLQLLAWPLARATGLGQVAGVGLVALVALLGLAALFIADKRAPALAFALGWFLIAISPAWLMLNADYTLNGPRLHYLPAVGAAMVWSGGAAILWSKTSLWAKTAGGTLLVIALVTGATFLQGMAHITTTGARLIDEVTREIAATPPGARSLVVNFPAWIGRHDGRTTFALGWEGLSLLPGYSTMRELVLFNTRQERDVTSLTFTNLVREWRYTQRLGTLVEWDRLAQAIRASERVWLVNYLPDRLQLRRAGAIVGTGPAQTVEATFGEQNIGLRPASYHIAAHEIQAELVWTPQATITQPLTVFAHVYDSQGTLVAQQDGDPLLGLYPLWLAQPGEHIHDARYIALPPDLPPGRYFFGVGLYDRASGARAAALASDGHRLENDVALLFAFERR